MVIVLSPHPDDAAFSLGGTIPQLHPPKRLVTVFGRSRYTIDGHDDDCEIDVTRRRRSEDRQFAMRNDLAWTYIDLPSAGLRQRLTGCAVFMTDGEAAASEADSRRWTDEICRAVFDDIDGSGPALLLLPAALGRHRDHVFVRECLRERAASRQMPIAFYEDLPYATALSDAEIESHMRAIDPGLSGLLVPIGRFLERKVEGLHCYPSQIDEALTRTIVGAATRYGAAGERLWTCCADAVRRFLAS